MYAIGWLGSGVGIYLVPRIHVEPPGRAHTHRQDAPRKGPGSAPCGRRRRSGVSVSWSTPCCLISAPGWALHDLYVRTAGQRRLGGHPGDAGTSASSPATRRIVAHRRGAIAAHRGVTCVTPLRRCASPGLSSLSSPHQRHRRRGEPQPYVLSELLLRGHTRRRLFHIMNTARVCPLHRVPRYRITSFPAHLMALQPGG